MADVTAQILVGGQHPWGGGMRPTHTAWLWENGRCAWVLEPTGRDAEGSPLPDETSPPWTTERLTWVPDGRENSLEDGLVMIAVHVLRDTVLLKMGQQLPALLEDSFVELEKLPAERLDELRQRCREIEIDYKLVITVLEHSSLREQLSLLERYPMKVEVCTVSYTRTWGGWPQQPGDVRTWGNLKEARAERAEPRSVSDLLAQSRAILSELRGREIIRSWNAPAGDYAEWLVQRATQGELARQAEQGWDVLVPNPDRPGEPEHLQVKARLVSNPPSPGQRQLSAFRCWNFDAAVVVLFDDDFRVRRAAYLPVEVIKQAARPDRHVHAERVIATEELLDRGEDWTDRLKSVAEE